MLLITMHHIVSDGWSMGVLMKELSALYGAFVRGEDDPSAGAERAVCGLCGVAAEVDEGEILQAAGGVLEEGRWRERRQLLELPTDHARPAQQDYAGGIVELVLDEELTAGLKELSRRHGTTLYMTLLAGWAALLGRLSGQEDVVIGTPVANRGRSGDRRADRVFREHAGAAGGSVGSADGRGAAGAGEGAGAGGAAAQDIPFEQVVEMCSRCGAWRTVRCSR